MTDPDTAPMDAKEKWLADAIKAKWTSYEDWQSTQKCHVDVTIYPDPPGPVTRFVVVAQVLVKDS